MDYKKIMENKLLLLAIVLSCIIFVQCITEIAMWRANRSYKALYDESLEAQRSMQEQINNLKADMDR